MKTTKIISRTTSRTWREKMCGTRKTKRKWEEKRWEQLLDAAIDALRTYLDGDEDKPYGIEIDEIGDYIVVADLDAGKEYAAPKLRVYETSLVIAWHGLALEFMKKDHGLDIIGAMGEAHPSDQD